MTSARQPWRAEDRQRLDQLRHAVTETPHPCRRLPSLRPAEDRQSAEAPEPAPHPWRPGDQKTPRPPRPRPPPAPCCRSDRDTLRTCSASRHSARQPSEIVRTWRAEEMTEEGERKERRTGEETRLEHRIARPLPEERARCACRADTLQTSTAPQIRARSTPPAPHPAPFAILLLSQKEELTERERTFPQRRRRGMVYISILPTTSTGGLCTPHFTPQKILHSPTLRSNHTFAPYHNELKTIFCQFLTVSEAVSTTPRSRTDELQFLTLLQIRLSEVMELKTLPCRTAKSRNQRIMECKKQYFCRNFLLTQLPPHGIICSR